MSTAGRDAGAKEPVVYIVDDEEVVRTSTAWLVGSVGLAVKPFARSADFLSNFDRDRAGCLILDVRMPDISGTEFFSYLKSHGYDLPVIFITAHADIPMCVAAMKVGAFDFFEKPVNSQQLLDRVLAALAHHRAQLVDRRRALDAVAALGSLTEREREVCRLLVAGYASKQIASQLDISHRTVDIHRANIKRKAGVNSLAELVALGLQAFGGDQPGPRAGPGPRAHR